MKFLYILLTSLFLPLCLQTQAQTYLDSRRVAAAKAQNDTAKKTQRLKKEASELTAKYIPLAKIETESIAVAKLEEYNNQVNEENLRFPADELYNSNWDTLNVNPFVRDKIEFPSTYTVNCNSFVMPIDNNIKITSKYGVRRRRMHRGVDLKVQIGDTIKAAFDGKIRIKSYERRGYGYYLVLRHPNGLETVYGHLSKFLVKENQIVRAGQAIALGGNTGRSTGSHLHFETRFLGRDINPAEIIDFENGVPFKDEYVFHNVKVNGKNTNVYTSGETAIHRVKKGETLSQIARKYGTTVDALCKLNGLTKNSKLAIGQRVRFGSKPIKVEATEKAIEQTTPATEQKTASTANVAKSEKVITSPVKETQTVSDGPVYHQIKTGDTLFSLAKRYGLTVEQLCELNNFKRNTIIKVGQKIRCS
ncbi:MAG: LysM peptidoglycan-binding domain-containing protein [Tannerella sp.]|jgi:murein DD-endopeptidase MepM/ murein hydrolase activator NlpD|nr:LysM peptidoglycan-binding domain-containing protein [Tannerella sp.]